MAVFAALISGCTSDPAFRGRVMSAEENVPVSGAIVVAFWRSTDATSLIAHKECDRLEVITSNAEGAFEIPAKFTPLSWRADRSMTHLGAYKAGLKTTEVNIDSDHRVSVKMTKITTGTVEKVDELMVGVRAGRHCGNVAGHLSTQLEEMIYAEAKPLAKQFLLESGRNDKFYSIDDIGSMLHAIVVETVGEVKKPPSPGTVKFAPAPMGASGASPSVK